MFGSSRRASSPVSREASARAKRTCGSVSASSTGSAVGARVIVVVEVILVAVGLTSGLICLRKRVL